jgi:hypothetical protein
MPNNSKRRLIQYSYSPHHRSIYHDLSRSTLWSIPIPSFLSLNKTPRHPSLSPVLSQQPPPFLHPKAIAYLKSSSTHNHHSPQGITHSKSLPTPSPHKMCIHRITHWQSCHHERTDGIDVCKTAESQRLDPAKSPDGEDVFREGRSGDDCRICADR